MNVDFKIRIVQPGVPEYRRGLLNRLGKMYGERIEIYANDSSDIGPACRLEHMRMDYTHDFRHVFGPFWWQRGISTKGLERGDVLVICGDVHHLSNMWVALVAKFRGIGVVWWGHHQSTTSTPLKIWLRLCLSRLLSVVYLCYTKEGKTFLQKHGLKEDRVFYTGNTIDEELVEAAIRVWDPVKLQEFQKARGLTDKKLLLICSVLREKTKVDQILTAMTAPSLNDDHVILAVIGDGEASTRFKDCAVRQGLGNRVLWVGSLTDQMELAPWFMSAKAFVYPGPIGLSLIHSYLYALPVIVHDNKQNQGPEFVAMHDGETGFVFHEDDTTDLAQKIARLICNEHERVKMGVAAKKIVRENYSMDNMARNYAEAIERAHALSLQL